MTAEELEKAIKAGQPPVVLDVRSAMEFKSGHIYGAVHAPVTGALRAAEASSQSKSDRLVIVCEHGPRAQLAKAFLKWRGYKNIDLLEGHMARWRQSGLPMQKGQ